MGDIQEININTENELPKRKLPEDFDMNVSVFKCPWSWGSWHGFWRNIKWFFRAWKPAWHRATKGYCRMDTWNVEYTLTVYLIKVLTEFRNYTDSWPDQYFPEFEDWIAAIDECIDRLIFSMRDVNTREEYQKNCEARKKAFEFLGEYLPQIWW